MAAPFLLGTSTPHDQKKKESELIIKEKPNFKDSILVCHKNFRTKLRTLE